MFIEPSQNQPHQAERGQGLVEYSLILLLVGVVSVGVLLIVGGYAQVEYRALHGAMVCGPKYSIELTDKILIVEDPSAETLNCLSLPKADVTYNNQTRQIEWDTTNMEVMGPA